MLSARRLMGARVRRTGESSGSVPGFDFRAVFDGRPRRGCRAGVGCGGGARERSSGGEG